MASHSFGTSEPGTCSPARESISSSDSQCSVGAMHFIHAVRMKVYTVSYWCPAVSSHHRRFYSLRSITGLKPNGRRTPFSNTFTCNKLYITTVRRRAISNGCWPQPQTQHPSWCHAQHPPVMGPKSFYTIADLRYHFFMQYISFSKAEPQPQTEQGTSDSEAGNLSRRHLPAQGPVGSLVM